MPHSHHHERTDSGSGSGINNGDCSGMSFAIVVTIRSMHVDIDKNMDTNAR